MRASKRLSRGASLATFGMAIGLTLCLGAISAVAVQASDRDAAPITGYGYNSSTAGTDMAPGADDVSNQTATPSPSGRRSAGKTPTEGNPPASAGSAASNDGSAAPCLSGSCPSCECEQACVVPNMIGDGSFFNRGMIAIQLDTGNGPILLGAMNVPGGAGTFKISDNENPVPQDRVFFNYNRMRDALVALDLGVRSYQSFEFGFEKTFRDGLSSFEVRLPFNNGLNPTQAAEGVIDPDVSLTATKFGNIPFIFKRLLRQDDCQALSAGIAVVAPTGPTGRVTVLDQELLTIQNTAWHIQPFVGWAWTPAGRPWFVEMFGAVDFVTNGNRVSVIDPNTLDLTEAGRYNEQTLGMLDVKFGYWLYRDPCARWITGIVPTAEFHYTTTLRNTDSVEFASVGPLTGLVTNPFNRMDVWDATFGAHVLLGQKATLTLAAAIPMTRNENKPFENDFIVQFDRRF